VFRDAGLGLSSTGGRTPRWEPRSPGPLPCVDICGKFTLMAETFHPDQFRPDEWRSGQTGGMNTWSSRPNITTASACSTRAERLQSPGPRRQRHRGHGRRGLPPEGCCGFTIRPGDFRYQIETGRRTRHLYEPDFSADAPFGPLKKSFVDYERAKSKSSSPSTRPVHAVVRRFLRTSQETRLAGEQDIFIGRGEIPLPSRKFRKAADHAWESCMTTTAVVLPAESDVAHGQGGHPKPDSNPGARREHAAQRGSSPDGRFAIPRRGLLRELGLWMSFTGKRCAVSGRGP